MDDVSAQPAHRSDGSPSVRQRAMFALSGAATFVIAATLFVSPAPTRSVEAILTWIDQGSNEVAPGLAVEELTSEEFLEEVLAASDPALPANQIDPLLAELGTGLHFERLAPTEAGRARLGIQYRGEYTGGPAAVNAAAQLVRQRAFVEPERLAARRSADLADQSEQTHLQIAQLQTELEELRTAAEQHNAFLHNHAAAAGEVPSIEGPRFAGDLPRLPGEQQVNPRWTALQEELAELEHRRAELLTEMSPLHPTVRTLNFDIEDRIQQLAATRQYLEAAAPPVASEANLGTRLGDEILGPQDRQISELELAILQARTRLVAQQSDAADALKRLDQLRALDLQVSAQAGPLPAVPGAGIGAFLALIVAFIVAQAVAKRATGEDTVFRSVREAAEALPVRIVGVIRSAMPIAPCPVAGPPRSIRLIRLASIGVLAVAFVALLSRMLGSDQFAAMAFRTPVRALAEAMRGLL